MRGRSWRILRGPGERSARRRSPRDVVRRRVRVRTSARASAGAGSTCDAGGSRPTSTRTAAPSCGVRTRCGPHRVGGAADARASRTTSVRARGPSIAARRHAPGRRPATPRRRAVRIVSETVELPCRAARRRRGQLRPAATVDERLLLRDELRDGRLGLECLEHVEDAVCLLVTPPRSAHRCTGHEGGHARPGGVLHEEHPDVVEHRSTRGDAVTYHDRIAHAGDGTRARRVGSPAGYGPECPRRGPRRRLPRPSVWSGRGDLNPRPPAPKAGALPSCATPRRVRRYEVGARVIRTDHRR